MPRLSRPREKLISSGRDNLTAGELLAILFSTGMRGKSALGLAGALLRKYPLGKLPGLTVADLTSIPGIGKSKAAKLLAALELGQRLFEPNSYTRVVINSLDDTLRVLREYADKKQEYLLCLYINARHELLQKEVIGMGNLNSLRIEPKELFRVALATPCAGIIIAHNHPSGDPTPSEDDIHFTKRIHEAGEVMGIPLLDHVIFTPKAYFSFRDSK